MRFAVSAALALSLASSGCAWFGDSAHQGVTALTVRVRAQTRAGEKTIIVRTLGCDPSSGTVPDPAAACAALRDYQAQFQPIHSSCGCAVGFEGERSAEVSGRLDGRPFRAELGGCMCGYTEREVRDLRVGTGLRTIAPPFGTITGRTLGVGGPAPGFPHPVGGALVIVTGHDSDGIRIRTGARSSAAGTFRIGLPAGRYTVRMLGSGPHHKTRIQVPPRRTVRVRLIREIL
jgi:subtilisin inhibitor-like